MLFDEMDDTEHYSWMNSTVFFHGMLETELNTARMIILVFVGQHLVDSGATDQSHCIHRNSEHTTHTKTEHREASASDLS